MEWNRGPIIGRGSSAAVYLATVSSGDLIAVKSTELSSSSFLQREQNFLSQINSPHIVKYLGYDVKFENDKPMYNIFLEYLSGGTLSHVMKKQGGSLDESMIRVYTNQILQGLDYLHSNNFVHCDIKGQNILLGKDGVKIADLGCATLLKNGVAATSAFSGTPVFMAPEVARGEEQGFPADIWSLGCTIIEMATGSNPWPALDHPLSAIHVIGFSGELPEFPSHLSENAKHFLTKCLKRNAKERWTAKQLLSHQFLVELAFDFEKVEKFNTNSPTSVLDLGFWDSVQVSEPCLDPSKFIYSSDYPAQERIKGLFASQVLPAEWAKDEDWVTVRMNSMENSAQVCRQSCDNSIGLVHMESFHLVLLNEEESESLIDIQDFSLLGSSVVQVISRSDTSVRTNSELSSVIDVNVSQISNLERQMNENNFLLIMNIVLAVHMQLTFTTSNFPLLNLLPSFYYSFSKLDDLIILLTEITGGHHIVRKYSFCCNN
ncbi:putative mitogen-activated protein (MAP) kinase kinase kinase Ste11, Cryptococcus [Heracleum sosnowskyi]|uniref:Mitogen-activated protein (MAP) kinase kinase kinase Ste11, Cryptococcus n=1 Tax=Heracleum sosnowskyi TaxID=360622 RepID=A0AAD8H6R4_9APIA|nr:putative mitogen-activated protein (MAP) kinase kinase kinase Ste11, Cryptococcus [Heracleum sosnowskyi]